MHQTIASLAVFHSAVISKRTRYPVSLRPHRCTINCITTWCNVFHSYTDDIAAAEFTVDGEVEQCKITFAIFDFQFSPN